MFVFGICPGPGPEVRELIAGGEDRDPGTSKHADLRVAQSRQQANLGCADRASGLCDHVAGADVFPGRADIGARRHAPGDRDPLAVPGDILLRYHRVGALRQGRAGEDPHGLTRVQGSGRERAGDDPSDDCELDRWPARVVGPDGVAVHRGVRPGWNHGPRDDGLREHPPERRHHVDALDRKGVDT